MLIFIILAYDICGLVCQLWWTVDFAFTSRSRFQPQSIRIQVKNRFWECLKNKSFLSSFYFFKVWLSRVVQPQKSSWEKSSSTRRLTVLWFAWTHRKLQCEITDNLYEIRYFRFNWYPAKFTFVPFCALFPLSTSERSRSLFNLRIPVSWLYILLLLITLLPLN